MANKWLKQLNAMEGATDFEYDSFAPGNVVQSPSPSLNWIFGKGSGLPFGLTSLIYGPPKAGKSLISYLLTAGLHAQDPNAIAVKFNTELREAAQFGDKWGIDRDRYIAYDVNEPEFIFDRIKNELLPMIQDGMPLKLIIIDSLQGIQGVKAGAQESMVGHLMGDHALTIGKGLKAIIPIIRRNKIALVCTEHVRANLDAGPYGKKEKMAGGYAEKHTFEYYIEIKRDGAAESKQSLAGEKLENAEITDVKGNKEKTGHKIYCRMDDSSCGVAGRAGRFTFDYDRGLINTEEEIFELVKGCGLVEQPNNRTYKIGDMLWSSKADFLNALKDEALAKKLLQDLYARDRK
jgi:RecA/RadA recombinase